MRLAILGFLTAVSVTRTQSLCAQVPEEVAWDILEKGHTSHNTKERINAARALGLLHGNLRAVELAEEFVTDRNSEVRAAAALTLGQLDSVRSIPLLKDALKDKSTQVDFAASSALLSLGDPSGYAIYYQVLTKKRKTGEGPLEEQKRLIKDPKAMTLIMLGTAAGFAPYAGYGWAMFQVLSKDYAGPVRVEAVQKLANDPNAQTETALIEAASDKSWKVRVAALEVLAKRGDPRLLDTLASDLSDKNQAVRCAAAAGFIRLSNAKEPEVQQSSTLH
ncbi:MAG TPA: HEAT repeat domain-containing protein [Candidatus Acidoferrum sp.]|nr:HEAT repeat domain-containing protein [Candidatus Acidoferrum sp.]